MASLKITLTGSSIIADASKSYTISDADLQTLLDTVEMNWPPSPPGQSPPPPTNQQLLLWWVQRWIDGTIRDIQSHNTTPPPPITIA
jgi:hypothetical protein